MATATKEKAVAEKPAKPAKEKLEVTLMAKRFEPECDTRSLKTPMKGTWVVEGQPGLYCFIGNLKPTGKPELTEGQVVANYLAGEGGALAPAVFERLTELEAALVAQING